MESIYPELALCGRTNQCPRTDTVFLRISEVSKGTVSLNVSEDAVVVGGNNDFPLVGEDAGVDDGANSVPLCGIDPVIVGGDINVPPCGEDAGVDGVLTMFPQAVKMLALVVV